jgi:hypothetical protein
MTWLIKFILKRMPLDRIVEMFCNAIRANITSKTETLLDDKFLDSLEPIIKKWANYTINPQEEELQKNLQFTIVTLLSYGTAITPFNWSADFLDSVLSFLKLPPAKEPRKKVKKSNISTK